MADLKRECQRILYATVPGLLLTEKDKTFILGVILPRHPRHADKVGAGVEAVTVRPAQWG